MSEQMIDDVFTAEDIAKSDVLGPAYYASRRASEELLKGADVEAAKKLTDKCAQDIREAVYNYVEGWMMGDLESNIAHHIQRMTERSVNALLTGEEWAMRQYPFAKYADGEAVRAAVAKHGGESLLMARIADLEKENARLRDDLKWYRDR